MLPRTLLAEEGAGQSFGRRWYYQHTGLQQSRAVNRYTLLLLLFSKSPSSVIRIRLSQPHAFLLIGQSGLQVPQPLPLVRLQLFG